MIIVKTKEKLAQIITYLREKQAKTGFIPTMGALHEGHLELLKTCREKELTIVCSIFVNPTQFNDKSDFEKYPVTIENDIYLLEKSGCEVLFLPSIEEMYPPGGKTIVNVDLGELADILEGKFRPGHFDGVCQIVDKLIKAVQPDVLFLGQKDYQQCIVIRKMIEQTNYTITPLIEIVPTKREASGLAMSSRNTRLSDKERENATIIYKALNYINSNYKMMTTVQLQTEVESFLLEKGFDKIDYIAVADAETLEEVTLPVNNNRPKVALIAAYINHVRLIDNILLT